MTDFPSDWHIQEAINRTPGHTSMTVARVKENIAAYGYIFAHARTLAEFLSKPEPVDPYVEAAAQLLDAYGWVVTANNFRKGKADWQDKAFLAKLRELFPAYGADTRTALEIAREAAAQVLEEDSLYVASVKVVNGQLDLDESVRSAILAVRMARGEA